MVRIIQERQHIITITGVTGIFKILRVSGLILTLDGTANVTVAGAAVALSAAVFADMADLAP